MQQGDQCDEKGKQHVNKISWICNDSTKTTCHTPFSQKLRWMYFQVDAGWINHLQELAKPETSWKKQRAKQQKTHPHQRFLIAARISFVSLVAVQQLWHLKRSGPALRHHIQTHNSGSIKSKCTAALHPPHPVMWHEVGVHIVKQCDFPPARLHNVAHGISKKQQRVVTPIQWQIWDSCRWGTTSDQRGSHFIRCRVIVDQWGWYIHRT